MTLFGRVVCNRGWFIENLFFSLFKIRCSKVRVKEKCDIGECVFSLKIGEVFLWASAPKGLKRNRSPLLRQSSRRPTAR